MNLFRNIIILLFLFLFTGLKAQTLVLHHADGTTTDVELYLMPRIQFENDKVLITSTVLDMEYPKDNVLRFSYKGTISGIDTPKATLNYSQENGIIVFHGIKDRDKVAVYNANGIRVPMTLSFSGDDVILPLSSLPSGVYVLSVNGKASKFTKP